MRSPQTLSEFLVCMDKAAVKPLCLPGVVQTRPQVGCDLDWPLPVDQGKESLDDDGPDVIFSRTEVQLEEIRCQS